jgi:hypothetical protein
MRWMSVIVLLAVISCGRLLAQRAPGMLISSPPPQAHTVPHGFSRNPIFFGAPWFGDYGYAVNQPAPQVIVVQPQPAVPEVKKEEAKPITPLLIEEQNGQYVRSDAKTAAGSPKIETQPSQLGPYKTAAPLTQMARDSAPAILVFRDGHREQVREYTLADGALYARGDYWTDGYWNRKILLSSLDLRATMAANRQSGIDFVLPSGPNVVVIGP